MKQKKSATSKDKDEEPDLTVQYAISLEVETGYQDLKIGLIVGKGSAGLVYHGTYTKLGKEVAIKCINFYDKEKRKQLLNDLRSLTAMSVVDSQGVLSIPCPFLVNFYGGFLEEGTVKVVLEFMDKGTLRDAIKKKIKIDEATLAMIAVQVLFSK